VKVLAVVPARGGSKGITNKNIIKVNGKPLLEYTVSAALGSKLLDRTILSSDSAQICEISETLGLEVPFHRPAHLASDTSPTIDSMKHAVTFLETREGYHPDAVMILQPTSPLRTSNHVDDAIKKFIESGTDSLVSVVEIPHNMIPESIMRIDSSGLLKPYVEWNERQNLRQNKPTYFARNGAAIYLFSYECLMEKESLYGDSVTPFIMSFEDSVDIDNEADLELASWLLSKKFLERN